MTKKIITTCETVMEVTWLLVLVSIPIYFNIYTSRVFEPDKITLFRSLVLVMLVAWAAKGLALLAADRQAARVGNAGRKTTEIIYPADGEVIGPDMRPFPQNIVRRPLVPFVLALAFLYIISTIFSIVPEVSWWGSYQRLQGTYTFLSYVCFFLVIIFNMRERRQLERLISFVLLGNIPVALYGLLQHMKADPLPWQGDVVFRVTSTMGNAIFIAAYLIMVVPLILYRIVTTGRWLLANRASAHKYFKGRNRDTAISWIALYGCFLVFLIGLFFVVLNFNANYRPESNTAAASSSTLPSLVDSDSSTARSLGLLGNESIGPWWALPLGIGLSFGLFFLFTVRRRGTDNNYLFRLFEFAAYFALLIVTILTMLYSQSRGPLAGLLIGAFVLFPIIFWRRKAWKWLIGWLGMGLVLGVLVLLYNLPPGTTPLEPAFAQARKVDQLKRLGQFLETEDGTGKVRRLIWATVLEAVGTAAQKEPPRVLIGFGPEALYNKSPQHYQPELGQVEARNAIPDRSHNGYLDALATTGVLGLLAYIALVLAFIYYAFRLMRRTERFEYQVLLASLISLMIAHQVEIQTGIQIATSWIMFWTGAALLVVLAGLIYGRWDAIGAKAVVEAPAVVETAPVATVVAEEPELAVAMSGKTAKKGSAGKSKNANRSKEKEALPIAATTSPKTTPVRPTMPNARRNGPVIANAFTEPENRPDHPVKSWYWAAVGGLALVALVYTFFGNVQPIMADTVYKQGFNLSQANQWQRAQPYLRQASEFAPHEDFYALYLGQAYLELGQIQAREAGNDKNKQAVVQRFLVASESELVRANKLAPLNPDHYANLARLYTRWADLEPARSQEFLRKATTKYREAVDTYAPRNPRLWSELAAAYAGLAANRTSPDGVGINVDKAAMDAAIAAGEKSVQLDDKYDFNRSVLGDLYRFAGRPNEAGVQYLALAEINPRQLGNDERFTGRIQALALSPQVPLDQALRAFSPDAKVNGEKITADTDKSFAYLSRGIIYFYKGDLEQASVALNQSFTLTPSDPYAHAYQSLIYKRRGQATQAQNEAAQALDLAGKVQQNPAGLKAAIERVLAS